MKKKNLLFSFALLGLWMGLSSFNLWPMKKFIYTVQDMPGGGAVMHVTIKGWDARYALEYGGINTLEELTAIVAKSGFRDEVHTLGLNISSKWKLERSEVRSVSYITSKAEYEFVRK